jgi:hypothetical protein
VGLTVSVDARTVVAAGSTIGVLESGALIHCKKVEAPRELVFESKHNYDDGSDIYTPVSIPGALKLTISFDPRTRTERGCGMCAAAGRGVRTVCKLCHDDAVPFAL